MPSGSPGPTMKSLAEIESRTPVDASNTPPVNNAIFSITRPGSYYLTGNIYGVASKYGIEILTNNVTLDLNGFALFGVTNAYGGIIAYSAATNLVVRNGTLSGWGSGFSALNASARNATLENLNASGNGFGLQCNGGAVIRNCVVSLNQRDGIDVQGSGSLIYNNTLAGNNLLNGAGNSGMSVFGTDNRIEGNHVTGGSSGFGLLINFGNFTNNIIIRNSVAGNGVNNYSIQAGNIVGPYINGTSGGFITNANPWANFSF